MDLQEVVTASRAVGQGTLTCRAQRLAGMLHKLHFPESETQADLLADVVAAAPSPAVGLLSLINAALDTHGVPVQQRLTPLIPLLDAQLAAAAAPGCSANLQQQQQEQQQQQQQQQERQPLVTSAQLSTALLAVVALLPDLSEDLPSAPTLLAELIGHFMAAGHLTFGLRELAAAVMQAGAAAAEGGAAAAAAAGVVDEEEAEDPPLVDMGAAGPMLLLVANAIKDMSGPAAAKAAWSAAGIDLSSLMPSFANSPADVEQLLQRHEAHYLLD